MRTLDQATTGCGGKAAGLARLLAAGERVPAGFAVPAGDVAHLTTADLGEPLSALGSTRVAVRSSADDEDQATSSAAGRYDSELDVPSESDRVLEAITRVSTAGPQVSVIVQGMVDARVAGVAFSVNPVTGDDEVVVTAVAGLADRLLAGEETGCTWRVACDGTPLERPEGAELLDPPELSAIVDTVRRQRVARGEHVDVEWAIDEQGDLWLLQCRAETAHPLPVTIEVPPGSWAKDDAHDESQMTPMGSSLHLPADDLFPTWTSSFGLIIADLRMRVIGGEQYMQVVPAVGNPDKPAAGPPPPWWLMGLVARIHPGLRRRMRTADEVMRSGLLEALPRRWSEEWRPEFVALGAELRAVDLGSLDDEALVDHVDRCRATADRALRIHFDLFIPYLVGLHRWVTTAERVLGWDSPTALGVLAGWSPASAESSAEMASIAVRVDGSPALREALADLAPSDDPVAAFAAVDPDLAAEVAAWVDVERHRLLGYDVGMPTVGETPGLTLALLRAAVDTATDHGDLRERGRARIDDAVRRLPEAQRTEVLDAFEGATRVYGLREDNVSVFGSGATGAMRHALLELGRRLLDAGRLDRVQDVMFLVWPEARGAALGSPEQPTDLRELVRRRQREAAWVRAHPGPATYGPEDGDPPDVRGLPDAGRTINGALLWAMEQEFGSPGPTSSPEAGSRSLSGVACGGGTHTGVVRKLSDYRDLGSVRPGDVVVCPITTSAWASVFAVAGALVCETGGALSHTAIVAREHGLPTVMGCSGALEHLSEGEIVTVDGLTGEVTRAG